MSRLFHIALFVCLALQTTAAAADEPTQDPPLSYIVQDAANLPPTAPIVIALHPAGHSGRRFLKYAKKLRLPWRIISPDAHRRTRRGYSWYPIRKPSSPEVVQISVKRVLALLDIIEKRWPDAPKPYLFGYSQGATIGLAVAAQAQERISGLMAAAGYLIPEDLSISPAASISPPIMILQGKRDRVVKWREGRHAASRFLDVGYNVTFVSHKQTHFIPRRYYGMLRTWVLAQEQKRQQSATALQITQ